MKNIRNTKRIRINDYRDYIPGKSSNGGAYGYWTDYIRLESGKFEVSFGCTSDMGFCPACGSFGNHYDDEKDRWTCGGFEVVDEATVLKDLEEVEKSDNEDCWVDVEFK